MQKNNVEALTRGGIELLRPVAFNVQTLHLAVSSNIPGAIEDSELSLVCPQQRLQAAVENIYRGCGVPYG